jgi:excisionase family DNA binding protein
VTLPSPAAASPWLNVREAAEYARCGRRLIYSAVEGGRLRAARIDGRRALRFHRSWLDAWLEASVKAADFQSRVPA